MKIVLLESLAIAASDLEDYAAALKKAGHEFVSYERCDDEYTQIERCKDADIIMIANMPLHGNVIRACEKLKFIDVAFTGVDHVDLKAAKDKHVAVSNASGYSNESVAELTLSMMIDSLRHVQEVSDRCRRGGTKTGLVGRELMGKTVGVIGYGKIGKRVAELCRVFDCPILIPDGHGGSEIPTYISRVPLDELLRQADIVTLHCPLNDSTRGLISSDRISLMKSGAILINTSRGPVVDSYALTEALNSGKLSAAAVDVFENEPPVPEEHPLLHAKNCLVTPHVAFATEESMRVRARIVFESLDAYLAGDQKNTILAR